MICTDAASSSMDSHIRLYSINDGSLIKTIDAGPGIMYNIDMSILLISLL